LKKVLITGALGQDGKILSKLYLSRNFRVYGLIKCNLKKRKIVKGVSYKNINLESRKQVLNYLIKVKPTHIIHLASNNVTYSKRIIKDVKKKYLDKNFLITKNLVDATVELNKNVKFIFAGSSLMYENTNKIKINEKTKFTPISNYAKYKCVSHDYLMNKNKTKKIIGTTAILFNHDSIERAKNFLIPKIFDAFKLKNKRYLKKIYSYNISGDFSHAHDICHGIYKLSLTKKKIDKIILSSGKRTHINDVIDYLNKYSNLCSFKKINKKENVKPIGLNLLARKAINYKSKKNLLTLVDEYKKQILN
jgi:GDPmannose 4,6-dehydratase